MPSEDLLKETARLEEIAKEIAGTSDRAAAITLVAFFDDWLAEVILTRFVPLSNTQKVRLFTETGPLATLYSKIEVGFAVGIYGPQTKAHLHNIRRIRNAFAHKPDVISFDHPRVQKLCRNLTRFASDKVRDRRRRYVVTLIGICICISRSLLDQRPAITPPDTLP